jgi:hypothetical protein
MSKTRSKTRVVVDCRYHATPRDAVNARLTAISDYAKQARRTALDDDNICDLIDMIDSELQEVIAIVRAVRNNA